MALFIGCQAKCVDLALTSGASNNYENKMSVIFNSAWCVFKCMFFGRLLLCLVPLGSLC